jgi:O-antigen/teichoic acid export membrane protein
VQFSQEIRKKLIHFGGWVTVSGIVSPLMVQSDRFFIASIVSVAAVSAYVIPFELVTQLAIATTAISTVAFPSLAALLQRDRTSAWASFAKWLGRTVAVMLIACTMMALSLPHLLPLWIGTSLPPESVRIGQWLCLGIFVNSVGVMYFAYLHADGRFRETAILHLVEFPLYVAVLLMCLWNFGTVGAAIAWVIRVCADTGILAFLCHRARASPAPVGAPA